jgi:GAF domain-containing protein
VIKPTPNFTRLDPGRPEIAILVEAMLRAREAIARLLRSWWQADDSEILLMAGGFPYPLSQLNRATQSVGLEWRIRAKTSSEGSHLWVEDLISPMDCNQSQGLKSRRWKSIEHATRTRTRTPAMRCYFHDAIVDLLEYLRPTAKPQPSHSFGFRHLAAAHPQEIEGTPPIVPAVDQHLNDPGAVTTTTQVTTSQDQLYNGRDNSKSVRARGKNNLPRSVRAGNPRSEHGIAAVRDPKHGHGSKRAISAHPFPRQSAIRAPIWAGPAPENSRGSNLVISKSTIVLHNAPPGFEEFSNNAPILRRGIAPSVDHVIDTGQVSHILDVATEDPNEPIAKFAGARTLLVVPMLKDNKAIGALGIYRQEVRPFSDRQIELVTNFAAQAVIAIENARLLNELRQRTTDLSEALEQQTATSEVLKVISGSLGDLDPVFQAILENATKICEAKFANLLLYEGDAFRVAAMHGAPQAWNKLRQRDPILRFSRKNPLRSCHSDSCPQQSSAGMIVANRDWSGYRQCVCTMTMIKSQCENPGLAITRTRWFFGVVGGCAA